MAWEWGLAMIKLPQSQVQKSSQTLEQIQMDHVLFVWNEARRNNAKTARILGISRATLYRYLKRYVGRIK